MLIIPLDVTLDLLRGCSARKLVYIFHMATSGPIHAKWFAQRVVLFLGITAFYVWHYLSQWWLLKVQNDIGGGRGYRDLESVLIAARCYERIGDSVYSTVETCGYIYGIFLLQFIQFFNLDSINLVLLGGFFVLLGFLILLGVAVFSARTTRQAVVAFLLVTSPGPWLLFERGNFDLLIIPLILLAAVFINSRLSIVAILLIAFTALMKFYTLPLLLVYILIEKRVLFRIVAAISICVVTPIILLDISRISVGFPNQAFVTFGLPFPGLWLNFFAWRFGVPVELQGLQLYLLGYLIFFACVYLMYLSPLRKRFSFEPLLPSVGPSLGKNIFLLFSSLYLFCFLAGMNYDHRLTPLIISLLLLNVVFPKNQPSLWFLSVQIAALWATIFFFGVTGPIHVFLAILGNICQLILAVYLLGAIYQTLESSSSLKWVLQLFRKVSRKAS